MARSTLFMFLSLRKLFLPFCFFSLHMIVYYSLFFSPTPSESFEVPTHPRRLVFCLAPFPPLGCLRNPSPPPTSSGPPPADAKLRFFSRANFFSGGVSSLPPIFFFFFPWPPRCSTIHFLRQHPFFPPLCFLSAFWADYVPSRPLPLPVSHPTSFIRFGPFRAVSSKFPALFLLFPCFPFFLSSFLFFIRSIFGSNRPTGLVVFFFSSFFL